MIDAHQHFWQYDPAEYPWIDESMAPLRRDFMPGDLLRDMEPAGVKASVAVQARQTLEETRWLLDLADRHAFIAGVVGWVDLLSDVGAQLEEFSGRPRLVGIRHIAQAEPDGFLLRTELLRGIARLAEMGLGYDILVYARQMPDAVAFARALPEQALVLDHLGKPAVRNGEYAAWRQSLDDLAALAHVSCKLSGLVTEADWRSWTPGQLRPYLDAALEAFGPSRVMLGSDWPVCTVAAGYREVIALVMDAISEYSADERRQITSETAKQFWHLGGDSR
jgi:L-fucono-1,5-lactonase